MGIDIKACLMEMIGTFALCYVGGTSSGHIINIALAHGFVLGFMIYAGANTSGSNFNPAVSLGLMLTGNLDFIQGLLYMAFQMLGAFLAGILVAWFTGTCGCPALSGYTNHIQSFILEFWATFFLALSVYGTAVDKRAAPGVFGLVIGGSLTMSVLGIGNFTGAALNPARYFGPKLAGLLSGVVWNNPGEFWIYLAGPFGGAVAAMFLYKFLFYEVCHEVKTQSEIEVELKI